MTIQEISNGIFSALGKCCRPVFGEPEGEEVCAAFVCFIRPIRAAHCYIQKKYENLCKKVKKALDLPLGLRCILIGKSANRKGLLMKIKDVEKLTGLTAKSIRYYESKNLIAVERNEENSYRNYTDGDVARLCGLIFKNHSL